LRLNRQTSDGMIADFQKDGASVGSIGTEVADATTPADLVITAGTINAARLWLKGGDSGLILDGHTNSVLPTDENSYEDNRTDLGSDDYRFKDLYLSGGVYLGGTSSANKLDDYEEGTWTPTLTFGGVDTGNVYGAQEGTYTKIGNTVYVTASVRLTTLGSGTGNAEISGLPFTVSAGSEKGGGTASYYIALTSLTSAPVIRAGTGGTVLEIRDGTATATNRITHSNFTGTSDIRVTATYFV